MTEILYRSLRLEARRIVAGDGRRQVVTFDSYHEPPGFNRPGFGEGFFASEGITAIHVMSYGNDWFQYPEIPELLLIIRQACADAVRVLAYGSSMGGYAAIRFAGDIGADAALALSPQYSLDRRKVPFETRWAADRRRIRFLKRLDGPIPPSPRSIVAFDSALTLDRRHAELLGQAGDALLLPLPHAGHPVGAFLNDIGLLRPLVLAALDGSFDPGRFLRAARAKRIFSAHWLANLAERQPARRGAMSIGLAERATRLAPQHAGMRDVLARRLAAAGRYDEAVTAHRQAVTIEPVPDYLWGLTKTLFAAGDLPAALAIAQELQRCAPRSAGYHAWAAKIREAQGDLAGTLTDLRSALRHDRKNSTYRFLVYRLHLRLRLARWMGLFKR